MRIIEQTTIDGVYTFRLEFEVPLGIDARTITVVANIIQKSPSIDDFTNPILYLEGGPGFSSGLPTTDLGVTKELLARGFQVFSLDQRGTGYSSALEPSSLAQLPQKDQFPYLQCFRSDHVIEDCEHIRRELGIEKWTLLGQSNGGFLSFIYLSKYPDALKQVLVTGGIPPIGYTNDHVYSATYARTSERNKHYYSKYPQDIEAVKAICHYLDTHVTTLPCGGTLSVERFQQLGLLFGALGGTDAIHHVVHKFAYELETRGAPTVSTLASVSAMQSFGSNIIYTFFLEAIYCVDNTPPSNWTADKLRHAKGNEKYVYSKTSDQVYFTGEMVYPSMFEDYAELRPLRALADQVHTHTAWSPLYNTARLGEITWEKVPVVAAVYVHDQYVDFDTSLAVKRRVFGDSNVKMFVTSQFFHNGLRSHPDKVLGALFGLLEREFD